MPSAPREAKVPLTRWQYFVKNLYQNSANSTRFTYNKIIYDKSEELQAIDYKSQRINLVLVLLLVLLFVVTSKYHNIIFVVAYLLLVIAGQLLRLFMLPKDIKAHLKDNGYRERY